jgi:hypothetical protein
LFCLLGKCTLVVLQADEDDGARYGNVKIGSAFDQCIHHCFELVVVAQVVHGCLQGGAFVVDCATHCEVHVGAVLDQQADNVQISFCYCTVYETLARRCYRVRVAFAFEKLFCYRVIA